MRSWLRIVTLILAVLPLASLLVLSGCSNGLVSTVEAPGDNPQSPVPIGQVRLNIAWPDARSTSRLIPTASQSLTITVTGPGITTPITATVTRPATSLQMDVPAGVDRKFVATLKDAANAVLVEGKVIADIAAGMTTALNLPILGLYDPGNDNLLTTSLLTTLQNNTTLSLPDILDYRKNDVVDNYKFSRDLSAQYTITLDIVETAIPPAGDIPITVTVQDDASGKTHIGTITAHWDADQQKWTTTSPVVFSGDDDSFSSGVVDIVVSSPSAVVFYRLNITKNSQGSVDIGVE
jgi:hypothetical protein